MPITTFSTSSLSEFARHAPQEVSTASLQVLAADAEDTPTDLAPTAEERFEDSVEDDSAAFFSIIEAFIQLFPSPNGEQLKNLADSLLLEGEDREDFILLIHDVLVGSGEEVDLDPDSELDVEDPKDEGSPESSVNPDEDESDEDESDEDESDEEKAQTAALLDKVRAMGLDPLTDALMNDGQAVTVQPDADDLSIQDDGEVDFSIIKPSVELPEGNDDGADMNSPINNPESPV